MGLRVYCEASASVAGTVGLWAVLGRVLRRQCQDDLQRPAPGEPPASWPCWFPSPTAHPAVRWDLTKRLIHRILTHDYWGRG